MNATHRIKPFHRLANYIFMNEQHRGFKSPLLSVYELYLLFTSHRHEQTNPCLFSSRLSPNHSSPSPISINSSSDPFRNQDMDSRHRRRLWRLYFGVLLMFPGRHDRTANKQRAEIKSAQVIQCEVCPINLSKEKRRCRQDILLCVCHTHIKIDHWDYVNI